MGYDGKVEESDRRRSTEATTGSDLGTSNQRAPTVRRRLAKIRATALYPTASSGSDAGDRPQWTSDDFCRQPPVQRPLFRRSPAAPAE
ncbi:unnamed protein product [Cuscuta campestris]|uniref:Uncharacterized protein n=1 Tax=Cuscuta campestris TaxID=132261 RepID=A0A484MQM3_9ASTE|nr:unnamed protein product [Cuscuta campestris]